MQKPGGYSITARQKERLRRALEPLNRQYDPAEQLLKRPFSSPGYHTTLKGGMVHPTRDSLAYAVALLDTGDEPLRERAEGILRKMIALQDTDPNSKTYGIWSWFYEEPLPKMSPPDWNWADFCGVQLLQVARDHRERIAPELRTKVDAAIGHAARAIQKRNVGPGYTNIAIMGTYVTLVAAEMGIVPELRGYAMDRLRNFHQYTRNQGAFTEYNSPTYTITALQEIGRMRQHVRDAEARRLVEDLYRVAWEEIAGHFHAPSRQWAGPHSRAYHSLLLNSQLALIERATDGRAGFGITDATPSIDEHRLVLPCPPDLEASFARLDRTKTLTKTFQKAEPPVVGTTHLTPAFALGTINYGDLWNQRRALIAYWGTPRKPSYLHLRFLHDGYDFAAAHLFSAQRDGRALAGIAFATDGGDTHISLDKIKNETITAKDLRLRFEFGGGARDLVLTAPPDLTTPIQVRDGAIRIDLAVPFAMLGETNGRWATGRDKDTTFLDVVLYSGEPRAFPLRERTRAALGVAVQIAEGDAPMPPVVANPRDDRLELAWNDLTVAVPSRPDRRSALIRAARGI